MVYIMTLYNTVLAMGSFTNASFLIALKGMWVEFVMAMPAQLFVAGPLARLIFRSIFVRKNKA